MNRLPLIHGYRPQAPLVYGGAEALSQARFLGQAAAFAQSLPAGGSVLNLCESRLAFLLGFAAALLRGQTSLLPPNKTAATVAAIRASHQGCYVLADAACAAEFPDALLVPEQPLGEDWSGEPPLLDADLVAALPFTSGSTGEPLPHPKTWGALVLHSGLLSQRLGFARAHIAATVPPQHTYGLETSVLAALVGGAASHRARPFFPQDLDSVLRGMPAPRLLVTTPVHLHALVQARQPLPPLAGMVCATAPLSPELAAAAERQFGAALYEIYGSTETGAIATRRTAEGEAWLPLPGVSLHDDGDGDGAGAGQGATVRGPHLDGAVRLADLIEPAPDGRFRLAGRSGDLLKVAGKRMSLAELNHRLLAIPGVLDGVVFLPDAADTASGAVLRPAALVVAPGLSEQQILEALRGSVDPAFLPRPLRRVAGLPRNEVGKLPRAALRELLRA